MTAATHHDDHPVTLPDTAIDPAPIRKAALIAAAVGGIAWVAFGLLNSMSPGEHGSPMRDWFMTYLCGFVFWTSLPFGALSLTMLGYLTTASWGIVFRRIFQASIKTLPVLFLLFIPVAISTFMSDGKTSPYWWSFSEWHESTEKIPEIAEKLHLRPEAVEENMHKAHDYLSPGFFVARAIIIFGVLGTVAFFIVTWAKKWEETDDKATKSKMVGLSGPGMVMWALLMTVGVTDWVMSVEPTWASSMFPVVFGMNMWMTTFAFSSIVIYTLIANRPDVLALVRNKYRIDIGSLLFGFTMLWAYASFSQYMLVWAGNLPEEIAYYRKRGDHGWENLAFFLMLFHFLFPFILFLFREMKTDTRRMRGMCWLLLVVGASDVIWWILPAVARPEGMWHVPMGFAAIVGVGGVWTFAFTYFLAQKPILPSNSEGKFLATWGQH